MTLDIDAFDSPTSFAAPTRLAVLIASCYGLMTVSFVNASHAFWMPSIARDLGLAEAASGALMSCAFWGMVVAMLIVGPLADRFGCRVIFVASALSQAVGMFTMGSANSFAVALAGVSLASFGTGAVLVIASPVIFKLYPKSRERMAYIFNGSCNVGAVLIVVMGMALLSEQWPWRSVYRLIAVLTLAYGLAFIFLPTPASYSKDAVRVRTRSLLLGSRLGLMLASLLLNGFVVVGAGLWLPTYLEQISKGSRMIGGVALILNAVVNIAASGIGLAAILRFGGRRVGLASAGLTAAALALAGIWADPLVVVVCFCVISAAAAGIGPVVFARAVERFSAASATMYSALHAISNLGCAVGVLAVGAMGQAWGLSTTLLLMSVLPAANLVILALLLPPRSAVGPTAPSLTTLAAARTPKPALAGATINAPLKN